MIQDIFPHQFNNDFISPDTVNNDDYILHYSENSILLKKTDEGFEIS